MYLLSLVFTRITTIKGVFVLDSKTKVCLLLIINPNALPMFRISHISENLKLEAIVNETINWNFNN